MGFWDKLFGKRKADAAAAAIDIDTAATATEAAEATAEAVPPAEVGQGVARAGDESAGEGYAPEVPAAATAPAAAEAAREDVPSAADVDIPVDTDAPLSAAADIDAAEDMDAVGTAAHTEAPPPEQEAAAPLAEGEEGAAPSPAAILPEEAGAEWPAGLEPRLRKRLEAYFSRLEELYPDKVVVRLNTGHKKLAERGAELRRLVGMEGELDRFFALGGFTYQRSGGGRPPLPLTEEDCRAMRERLQALFPQGIPTVMAVRDADSRLFLDLRAVARREGLTVGDYLRRHRLMDPLAKDS